MNKRKTKPGSAAPERAAAVLCLECGSAMKVSRENVAYRSLPGVVLEGIEVRRCPSCGESEVVIPQPNVLDRTLARSVIEKRAKLTGDEIRFLRTFLDLSAGALAGKMGTQRETVSRWESGKQPIGTQADKLLRMMVAYRVPVKDYLDVLDDVATEESSRPAQRLAMEHKAWSLTG